MADSPTSIAPGMHLVDERERALLAPYALHSSQSAGRKYPEPRPSLSRAVPTRPRSDRPHLGLSPAELQDASLHRRVGRLSPHPADPHAGSGQRLADRRPGTGTERRSDRSLGPGPRPGPSAVRPLPAKTCSIAAWPRSAGFRTTSTPCGWSKSWKSATTIFPA